jgi:hypothetical protein
MDEASRGVYSSAMPVARVRAVPAPIERVGRSYWAVLFAVIFAGVACVIVLWPLHQDIQGASMSCGGNAVHAVQIDPASVDSVAPGTGDPGTDALARSLARGGLQGCHDQGRNRLAIGFWVIAAGAVVSLIVNGREKRRI